MRKLLIRAITPVLAIAVCFTFSHKASSQTPFAGEDFDGGATNGGLTGPKGTAFSLDLSGTLGRFPSSAFDFFGIVSTEDGGPELPDDLVDTSLTTPGDDAGILRSTDTDNVFVSSDLRNDDNDSGVATASWTFDILGKSNILLSIDLAMTGDFESMAPNMNSNRDRFTFTYSIDGGAPQTAFDIIPDEDAQFTFAPESGDDFVSNFFFDVNESNWLELTAGGPFFTDPGPDGVIGTEDDDGDFIDFDPADTDMDGRVDTILNGVATPTRSFQLTQEDGDMFVNPEFVTPIPAEDDPLVLSDGTPITDVLTSFTTPISGTGTTLTLTLDAESDGGFEFLVFDDILLSEDDAVIGPPPGDFNEDSVVNAADFVVYRDGASPNGLATLDDFNEFAANFELAPQSVANTQAVPEPTTGLLFLLSLAGVAARRR